MTDKQLLYAYNGEMSNPVLNKILSTIQTKLGALGEKRNVVKNINTILIECCQNLIYHAKDKGTLKEDFYPSVSVYKDAGGYRISTRNVVVMDEAEKLEAYLKKLNGFSPDDLKAFYKERLTDGKISAKGGGGLGLLNMIRASKDGKLAYRFDPVNDKYLMFTLSFLM
jgi:hypothetical protein